MLTGSAELSSSQGCKGCDASCHQGCITLPESQMPEHTFLPCTCLYQLKPPICGYICCTTWDLLLQTLQIDGVVGT
jgi:hypothetical protein